MACVGARGALRFAVTCRLLGEPTLAEADPTGEINP